jgi:hypothetical protein
VKGLPVRFLEGLGLTDLAHYVGHPAVRIPYRDPDGAEGPVRFRLALEKGEGGDNRFAWKKESKPTLYGLDRLDRAREAGYVILVEGESDCHTLWYYGFPALGVRGPATGGRAATPRTSRGSPRSTSSSSRTRAARWCGRGWRTRPSATGRAS